MSNSNSTDLETASRAAFNHYLRTGNRYTGKEWLAGPEAKFNPYHDELGRFTSPPGVTVSYGNRPGRATGSLPRSRQRAPSASPTNPNNNPVTANGAARRSSTTASMRSRGGVVREAAILHPRNLDARARAVGDGSNQLVEMPDLRVVLFGPGVSLMPVPVPTFQDFDSAPRLSTRIHDLDAVITGPQFDFTTGSDAVHGQALIGGRVYGKTAPGLYYFGTTTGNDGVNRLTFGRGDPVSSKVNVGFGGGVPLLMNGKNVSGYNIAWNSYKETRAKGKNIVAYNSSSNRAAIFIQPNGGNGYTLSSIRDYLRESGYDFALLFDGSKSVSLIYRGRHEISPQQERQILIPLGIGFRSR